MKEAGGLKYEIVQDTEKDWFFVQRESQRLHTTFEWEQAMLSSIRDGNVERLDRILNSATRVPLMVGKLSTNSLRQAQYLGVVFISLACRACIQGGMLEMDAYNMSDRFIQRIDELSNANDAYDYIIKSMREITLEMRDFQTRRNYSQPIRACLEFIYKNLHSKITLDQLARVALLSEQHLSSLFKKEVGKNITPYILEQKINVAKDMLIQSSYSSKDIAHYLAFSSQSHFIACFKRYCGTTPRRYQKGSYEALAGLPFNTSE